MKIRLTYSMYKGAPFTNAWKVSPRIGLKGFVYSMPKCKTAILKVKTCLNYSRESLIVPAYFHYLRKNLLFQSNLG